MKCSACGAPAEYLVTYRYGEGPAGRLMYYCDRSANERANSLSVRIPIRMIQTERQIDDVLIELYRGGYTETVPSIAAEVLKLPELTWVAQATELLKARGVLD